MPVKYTIGRFFLIAACSVLTLTGLSLCAQSIGGMEDESGKAICITPSGLFLFGEDRVEDLDQEQLWMLHLNENYVVDLSVYHGWPNRDKVQAAMALKDGNMVFIGDSWYAPGPGTHGDVYVNKVSPSGELIWSSYIGGSGNDFAFGVTEDENGRIWVVGNMRTYSFVGGSFVAKLSQTGELLFLIEGEEDYNGIGRDIVAAQNGFLYLLTEKNGFAAEYATSNEFFGPQPTECRLKKLDKNGNLLWDKRLGGFQYNTVSRVFHKDGFVYVLGSSMDNSIGSFDMVLYKYDANGNFYWRKRFGDVGYEYGLGIDIDDDGNMILCGATGSSVPANVEKGFLVMLDNQGSILWEKVVPGELGLRMNAVAFLDNGNVGVVGTEVKSNGIYGLPHKDLWFQTYNLDGVPQGGILNDDTIESHVIISSIQVFPVPATDLVHFEANMEGLIGTITLYNLRGEMLLKAPFENQISVDLMRAGIPSGSYLYDIETDSYRQRGPFLVK